MGAENACRVKSIRQDRLERAVLAAIQAQIWLTDFPSAAEVLKKPEAKQRLLEWKKLLACKERERKKIQNILTVYMEAGRPESFLGKSTEG